MLRADRRQQPPAASPRPNRRDVLRASAAAGAAAVLAPLARTHGQTPPSSRVRLGIIGCGGRARQLEQMFLSFPDVETVAICDPIQRRMDQYAGLLAEGPRPSRPDRYVDYRRILDRPDVDAVVIATPEHWHAAPHIEAAAAGKHIFIEKPLSHTVVEGRRMVEATRRHGVVALMGTQQRAGPHYQQAVELVQNGSLGTVPLVECWNYHNTRERLGRPPDQPPPGGYDWDRWLGPAPDVPYNPARLVYSWWFDYGGGMMTNWAVHHVDIILWAMQQTDPLAVQSTGGKLVVDDIADAPDTLEATWTFPDWVLRYHYRGFNNYHFDHHRPNHHGICFHGNRATLVVDRHGYSLFEDGRGEPARQASARPYFDAADPTASEQDGPWQRTFIDCVKGDARPPLELEASHKATSVCLLGNIAYRTGRTIHWDGAAERIAGDAEAAEMLDKPRRPGYPLPAP